MAEENNIVPLPRAEDIEEEAANWLTILGREDVTAEDRAACSAWLKVSDRHREAFNSFAQLWADMEALKLLDEVDAPLECEMAPVQQSSLPSRRRAMAMAASVAGLTVAGGALYWGLTSRSTEQGRLATAVGEQKTLALSDGSVLILNTNTIAEVAFDRRQRLIRLVQGEAFFTVAKDRRRPFIVASQSGYVTAVGTAFSVRVYANKGIGVTVEEGRVSVSPNAVTPSVDAAAGRLLSAGQAAMVSDGGAQVEPVAPPELTRRLAWRSGVLAYAGEPLSDVIAEISRYTDLSIDIADPEIASAPVAGYFRAGEMDALFETLTLNFGISIERVDEKTIWLHAPYNAGKG